MFFVIFGTRSSKIKSKELKGNTVCSKCNSVESFNVQGSAEYFYLFWIPLIPLRKSVEFVCRKCGQHHFKETAPRNVLSNYESEPLKRPKWHFLGLGLIVAFYISLNAYGLFNTVKNNISQKEYEEEVEQENQVFYNDLASVSLNPNTENDTISHRIKSLVDFESFGVNENNVSYFSKQNNDKLLILINIENGERINNANRILLLKTIKTSIFKSYPSANFDPYIGLFDDKDPLIFDSQYNPFSSNSRYGEDNPFPQFYREHTSYTRENEGLVEKRQFLYANEGKVTRKIDLDTNKLSKVWNDIMAKYKFKYIRESSEPIDTRLFIYNFSKPIPSDIKTFFDYQNLNGPFLNIDMMYSAYSKINRKYDNIALEELNDSLYINSKKTVLPVAVTPEWYPIYEDQNYVYAMDMLPDENGYVGQIILLGNKGEPNKFIAKDLVSFLKLYLAGKVAMDIKGWN